MAETSPLKSGPSTIKGAGSVYESPMAAPRDPLLIMGNNTSTAKKVVVPPLNFDKVFEQQRLILE